MRRIDQAIATEAQAPSEPAAAQEASTDRTHRWQIFHANRTIWSAVFELCETARERLEVEQYIFSHEGIGERLLDLLTAKARQGVAVRLLVDAYGSRGLSQSRIGRAFRAAGGAMVRYNPPGRLLRHPIGGLHRLHRKSVLCDGRRMMVGGSCFADRMSDWRDTMVRIEGPIVPSAVAAFETAWRYASGASAPEDMASTEVLASDPPEWDYLISEPVAPARQAIYTALLQKMRGAKRSVTLTTPYLIPDRQIWNALKGALERGVCLRLLIPEKSDHPAVDILSRRFANALSRRGAEIHAYEPTMMHAKIAMIDHEWASVSSFNLDMLSIQLNVENGLVGRSPDFLDALELQFECDMATSRRF